MSGPPVRVRLAAAALLLVATAAGCSGDDGDEPGPGAADATTTTTTVPEVADPVADAARAEEIVLKLSDLPEGWTAAEEPEGGADEEERLEDSFARCLGVEPFPDQPSAGSPEFLTETLTQVSATVEIAPSVQVAETEFANLQRPRLHECVQQQFDESQADSGLDFAPSRAQELDFPDLGDGTVATRITTLLTSQGQEITIYADIVFVLKGRVQITLYFLKGFQPFPPELADSLARRMTARA